MTLSDRTYSRSTIDTVVYGECYTPAVRCGVSAMQFSALLAASLLLVCPLLAQEPDEPSRGPDDGTEYFVNGIKVLPAPGRPFSGRSSTEWTRTLEDGTVVTTHAFGILVARDREGRIVREVRSFVPVGSNEQSPVTEIRIFDPVTHSRTACKIATHRCNVTGYHAPTSFTPRPPGAFDDGKRNLTRESIGNDVIDGISVVGTRETVTTGAGVIGNSQPLVVTNEFWYSPDLQVNLAVTRKDPREGTQVVRVGDVSRSEPDPALFKIPAGFQVENGKPAKTEN